MADVDEEQKSKERRFSWGQVVGIVIVLLVAFVAAQYPHNPLSILIRVLLVP
jgi:hypothetical protein